MCGSSLDICILESVLYEFLVIYIYGHLNFHLGHFQRLFASLPLENQFANVLMQVFF